MLRMPHAIPRVEIHVIKLRKKEVNTESRKHMDLYFATCKLRAVEIQTSVADLQVVFYRITSVIL